MRVESVCRSWLLATLGLASWGVELVSLTWIESVTMALWVTLRGIIVLGTGAFKTIWAASAVDENTMQIKNKK